MIVCDGCRKRVPELSYSPGAIFNVTLGGERHDWCQECAEIVRVELPKVVARARANREALGAHSESTRQRARNLWSGMDIADAFKPPTRPGA